MEDKIKYDSIFQEIGCLIVARSPIIWVVTHEEDRFISELNRTLSLRLKKKIMTWTSYLGMVPVDLTNSAEKAEGPAINTSEVNKALDFILNDTISNEDSMSNGNIYIMKDFHVYLHPPQIRQIKDMYIHMKTNYKTMIIVTPVLQYAQREGLPPELEKQISVLNFNMPSFHELKQVIENSISIIDSDVVRKDYTKEEINDFAMALQGLTLNEAKIAIMATIALLHEINVQKLISEKKRIIAKSDILEFIDNPPGIDEVGGLDNVINYFKMYKSAYTEEAKSYGVETLKGVLFLGVPGVGKSLLAKTIASEWQLPLLKLDIGKIMSGVVGSSENRMRQTIMQCESIAPAILWIDEVEKALSGTKSSNFSDGGTMARVFGTLLQAMQEGLEGVTILATANDISALPPEFIRRFNDVFFMDLPGDKARQDIFKIHLKKRGRDPKNFDLDLLSEASYEYTGAEIEKSLKDAIANAYCNEMKEVSTEFIVNSLKATKPISKMMHEQIKEIRNWAKDRAKMASTEPLESRIKNSSKSVKVKPINEIKMINEIF